MFTSLIMPYMTIYFMAPLGAVTSVGSAGAPPCRRRVQIRQPTSNHPGKVRSKTAKRHQANYRAGGRKLTELVQLAIEQKSGQSGEPKPALRVAGAVTQG